jgi:hypothetical protein
MLRSTTNTQEQALQELKEALDTPVVKRQEEAYCTDDYIAIEGAARALIKAFGMKLAELDEVKP